MKHHLTFEFTPDEINVLQVALDHMAKDLDELKNDDKIKADDKRVKNCTALIKGFHLLMSSVTHRPSI